MKRLLTVILAVVSMLLFVSVGFGAEKEIRIGLSTPMTGRGAPWGMPCYQGIMLAVEEVNVAGGVTVGGEKYKINLIAEDNKYEVATGLSAMEKQVYRDKVHVLWTFGGVIVSALQEKLEKIPMLNFVLVWGAQYRGPKYPYTYSVGMIPSDFGEEFYEWCYKRYPDKPLMVIGDNTQSGHQTVPQEKVTAAKAGFKIAGEEWYEADTTDFYPLISRLKASGCNIGMSALVARDTGLFLKQRDELGAEFVCFHVSAVPEEAIRIAPKASERNFVFRYSDYSATPKLRAFDERYRKRWRNEPPTWSTQEAYDFVGVYTQAVQKAGTTDIAAVKAALDDPAFTYEGLMGTMRWGGKSLYGRNCNMYYPIGIGIIKDGKPKGIDIVPVRLK